VELAEIVQATNEPDHLPRVPGLFGEKTGSPGSAGRARAHPHPHARGAHPRGRQSPSLVDLMRMTPDEWDLWTRGSAIRRAGDAGFKRNVAVAMGNWSAAEVAEGDWLAEVDEPPEAAVSVLRRALQDGEPLVREHATWALGRWSDGDDNSENSRAQDDPHRVLRELVDG
jgi:hypothetical protein